MNLAWKEFRESYPVLLIGLSVLLIGALFPSAVGFQGRDPVWGISYHLSGAAIFLFISLLLGVTSFALEAEQETLETLRSKPVPDSDILATKIGTRLGLLALSVLAFGIMEIAASAWPIRWGIPDVEAFWRWVGVLSITVLGYGVGLYFGRIRKQQTEALLGAALLIGIGFVILNLTPLRFLFEDPDVLISYSWTRGIMIPALVGVGFTIATIPTDRRGWVSLPRWLIAVGSLGVYALVIWSFSAVPNHLAWSDTGSFRDYWNIRFGAPAEALEALMAREPAYRAPGATEEMRIRSLLHFHQGPGLAAPGTGEMPFISNLLTNQDPPVVRDEDIWTLFRHPVTPLGEAEEFLVAHRAESWLTGVLDQVRSGGSGTLERMYALHAVAVAGHPSAADEIAESLTADRIEERLLAARLLCRYGDPRGRQALLNLLPEIRSGSIISTSDINQDWTEEEKTVLDLLMRSWIEEGYRVELTDEGEPALYRLRRSRTYVALAWFRSEGNIRDLDLVRRGEWSVRVNAHQRIQDPSELNVREYRMSWGDPAMEPIIREEALGLITHYLPLRAEVLEFVTDPQNRRPSTPRNVRDRRLHVIRDLGRLQEDLIFLFERHGESAIDLWQYSRPLLPLLYTTNGYISGLRILEGLARVGGEGLESLSRILEDSRAPAECRVQAGLLIVEAGRTEAIPQLRRLISLYGEQSSYFWLSHVPGAMTVLAARGHLEFAGDLIERANRAMKTEELNRAASAGRSLVGPWFWNERITRALAAGTGVNMGWDLKAWTTWWEREGSKRVVGDD